MFCFRHFAAPAIVGAALLIGGCANDHKDMPGNAQLMSEGRDTVSATAPHDGTVYIYDDTSHKNVYTGRVVKGDSVVLDAKDNKVRLNNNTALEKDLVNDHRYQIYFDRDETREPMNASHREGATIVAPQSGGGATIVQPNGSSTTVMPPAQQNTTVIPPAPQSSGTYNSSGTVNSNGTVVQPNGTVVQPNGTVVQPNSNGGTTVITPTR